MALTSVSSLVAVVIKGSMITESKCHQNNSPVVYGGYMGGGGGWIDRVADMNMLKVYVPPSSINSTINGIK